MKLGAVNVAGRLDKGNLSVAPIETTLNGGVVHLEPAINRDPTGDGFTVVLGEESTINDAQINDEVSHRVLSFLIPFMANATRANGMLDVQLSHAEFPIGSTAGRKTLVEGEVEFKEVQFSPGPLMEDLFANLGPLGRNARPSVLRLNHPVMLSIHDGRVHQHGLALPLGNVSEIAVDGSVGFDRSIDLKISLPITTAMLGGPNPLDGNFGGDLTRFTLPITGTLSKPKIDPDAFKLGMQQTGRDLFQGAGILQGVDGLIQLFNRPRDPNAPPPPTAEERREQRLEKKRERQMRRQLRRNGGILP
jgi:translocation and assembly module TamB